MNDEEWVYFDDFWEVIQEIRGVYNDFYWQLPKYFPSSPQTVWRLREQLYDDVEQMKRNKLESYLDEHFDYLHSHNIITPIPKFTLTTEI